MIAMLREEGKERTLMSNPLALLDGLWTGAEGHKVALDNMLGVGRVEPHG